MLRVKFYYQFLLAVNREVAREVRDEYTETMARILFSYFKGQCHKIRTYKPT
jgi:vacuolar protein sorting-associated protein 52